MKTKCSSCGYEWETGSELINVTCPSCQKKTKREQEEEKTNN